jgi:hypothetical protein
MNEKDSNFIPLNILDSVPIDPKFMDSDETFHHLDRPWSS